MRHMMIIFANNFQFDNPNYDHRPCAAEKAWNSGAVVDTIDTIVDMITIDINLIQYARCKNLNTFEKISLVSWLLIKL